VSGAATLASIGRAQALFTTTELPDSAHAEAQEGRGPKSSVLTRSSVRARDEKAAPGAGDLERLRHEAAELDH
jgi:hypothetical protein